MTNERVLDHGSFKDTTSIDARIRAEKFLPYDTPIGESRSSHRHLSMRVLVNVGPSDNQPLYESAL